MLQNPRYTVAYAILVLLCLDEFARARSGEGAISAIAVSGSVVVIGSAGAIVGRFFYRKVILNGDIYRVWYGTNRQPPDFLSGHYLNSLGTSIQLGSCLVSVPKSHKFGSLGSSEFDVFFKTVHRIS
jgi:hypothetical protein